MTGNLFESTKEYGHTIFRITRLFVLSVFVGLAVFWGAEAFELRADVLASPTLEDQIDAQMILLPLLEMEGGEPHAQVVPAVTTCDRLDGIRSQVSQASGLGHCLLDLRPQTPGAYVGRVMDVKDRHTRILTDWRTIGPSQGHVALVARSLGNDMEVQG